MNLGRVSVIIPAFNYGRYLESAVRSVQAQTFRNWDITIVDDGSTDDTAVIGQRLAEKAPDQIRFFSRSNAGVAEARNFAISQSDGEFIMPLDADDLLLPTALEDFVDALRRDPRSGYAYSNLENINILPGDQRLWQQGPFIGNRITIENSAASASMWRRSLFEAGVRYRKMIFEDWDLWLQIVAKGFRGFYVPKVLFQYRLHLSGRTAKNKFLYFPAMLEAALANPSLYESHMKAWAKQCLGNSPECWNTCSVVFLPAARGQSTQSSEPIMRCIAQAFVARGHFCATINAAPSSQQLCDGVAPIAMGQFSLEAVLHRLGMLGASVLVISELPAEFNRSIRAKRNIAEVISLHHDQAGAHGASAFSDIPILSSYIDSAAQMRFSWQGQQDLGVEPLVEKLTSLARVRIDERREEDKRFWSTVQGLGNRDQSVSSGTIFREAAVAEPITVIMSMDEQYGAGVTDEALAASLASLRVAAPSAKVMLLETGGGAVSRENVANIARQFDVDHRLYRRELPYSRAFLVNQILGEISGGYILLAPVGAIFDNRAFKDMHRAIAVLPEQGLFLGEALALRPIPEPLLRECSEMLSSVSFSRVEARPSIALMRTDWFRRVGGLCGELVGEGADLEELRWHAETLGESNGARVVWLPTGLIRHPWQILRSTVSELAHNQSVLNRYRQIPRHSLALVGGVVVQRPPSAIPSPERRALEMQLHALALKVEHTLRAAQVDPTSQVKILVGFGTACVEHGEFVTAGQVFEDAEALAPDNVEVALGLARVSALAGRVVGMGHYASKALMREPANPEARRLLEAIGVTWFTDGEVHGDGR